MIVGMRVADVEGAGNQAIGHDLEELVDRRGRRERPDAQRVEEVRHEANAKMRSIRHRGVFGLGRCVGRRMRRVRALVPGRQIVRRECGQGRLQRKKRGQHGPGCYHTRMVDD